MKSHFLKYFLLLGLGFYLTGCSSNPYDLSETEVNQEEETVTADTVKTVTRTREKIKENITEKSESFTFVVQIGAYIVPSNFDRFYATAKARLGDRIYYEIINGLYKIRLGKFDKRAEALQLLDYVKSLGYDDAFIITVRNK